MWVSSPPISWTTSAAQESRQRRRLIGNVHVAGRAGHLPQAHRERLRDLARGALGVEEDAVRKAVHGESGLLEPARGALVDVSWLAEALPELLGGQVAVVVGRGGILLALEQRGQPGGVRGAKSDAQVHRALVREGRCRNRPDRETEDGGREWDAVHDNIGHPLKVLGGVHSSTMKARRWSSRAQNVSRGEGDSICF